MLQVVMLHAFGLIEIGLGCILLVGALLSGGEEGHLGFGVLLVAFGTWAWIRGVRARRASARKDL